MPGCTWWETPHGKWLPAFNPSTLETTAQTDQAEEMLLGSTPHSGLPCSPSPVKPTQTWLLGLAWSADISPQAPTGLTHCKTVQSLQQAMSKQDCRPDSLAFG